MSLLLKGMKDMEGTVQEGPATLPSEWGTMIDPLKYDEWEWATKRAVVKVLIA